MGLLDGMLGGLVGAGMASVVNGFMTEHGGVSGMVSKFEQAGLGPTVRSWVSTGPNATISADQVHQGLAADLMQQLAATTGLSEQDLAQRLSQILPDVVDKLTPGGVMPKI